MKKAFLAAASALVFASSAQAATVVDTGTPVGRTQYTLSASQSLAGLFAVTAPTKITSLEAFIRNFTTNSENVTATLFSDGSVPSAANALFSTTFSVAGESEGWFGASGLNWDVGAGNFWLGFATGPSMSMRNGAPSPLSGYAFTSIGNWLTFNALGTGIRVEGTAGAVPEPATWAMMLMGFGFVGGAMRSAKRRQKLTVSYA